MDCHGRSSDLDRHSRLISKTDSRSAVHDGSPELKGECIMGCRIGMAVNVAQRVADLKAEGKVPNHATYVTKKSGLTYAQANSYEATARANCGPQCQGNPGGGYVSGPVWSVYRIDW